MKMRHVFILAGLISATAVAIEFAAVDLDLPVYDGANQLIRRLKAQSAKGPVEATQLTKGTIEFFSPALPQKPTAILAFDHALYRKANEVVRSDTSIQLTTDEGTVSGRGYEGNLTTGVLTLKSEVTFVSEKFRVTGSEADVRFDSKAKKRDEFIQEAIVRGDVVIARQPTAKAAFERAQTEFARYDAAEQKVYLKCPITTWTKEEKGVVNLPSGFFELDLRETGEAKPADRSE